MPDPTNRWPGQLARRWPLVGRDADIDRTVARLLAPDGHGVLVTGPAGVGKSRLVQAVLHRCVAKGHHVRQADEALAEWLPRPSGRQLVVVAVDDAHTVTGATARLVGKLGLTDGVRLLLATDEALISVDPVDELRRSVRLDRVDLAPLDWRHTRELAAAVLGADVDGLTADRLWQLSRGNPLLLREVLRDAAEHDGLTCHDHVVSWREDLTTWSPTSDTVTATLDSLSAEETEALRYVTYGDPAPVEVIERLAPTPVVERLEELGLIRLSQPGPAASITVADSLTAHVVRARTGPLRARRVAGELVAAQAAAGTGDRVRDVRWRLAAQVPVAEDEVLRAADQALLGHDAATAEHLARQVTTPAAAWHLGRALLARGDHRSAERLLAEAYQRLTDPVARANVAALRAVNLCWGLDRPHHARQVIAEARGALPVDVHADLLVAQAFVAVLTASVTEATDAVDRLADLPPRDPFLASVVPALRPRLLLLRGEPVRAVAELGRSLGTGPAVWPAMHALGRATHVQALVMAGEVHDAADLVRRYYRDALRRGAPDAVAALALVGGICAYYQGRAGEAARWLREARALTADQPRVRFRHTLLAVAVGIEAQLGQVENAHELLSRLDRAGTARTTIDYGAFGEVWALVVSGNRAGAATALHRLAVEAAGTGNVLMAMEFLHVELRLAPSATVARRVRELAARTDGRLFTLFADHAAALTRRDARAMNRISAAFEELGYRGFALEAAANGAMFGGGRVTNALARRTQRLLGEHQGTWPEWLPEPRTAPALTDRERQVSELAASGLDTPTIARTLAISARTAENHLQRAYGKLGIHRRHELATALAEDGFVLPGTAGQEVGNAVTR